MTSSSMPEGFDELMEQLFNTDEWKDHRPNLRTYNCVFLPPYRFIESKDEAQDWVEGVFADLSKGYQKLGGDSPLKQATQPGHFTIVLNTEFGFNGVWDSSKSKWNFNASCPIELGLETILKDSIAIKLREYQDTHNILFVLSCCTVEEVQEEEEENEQKDTKQKGIGNPKKKTKQIGRNRLTILSTKSLDTPIIVPKKFPDSTDGWKAGIEVETFGFEKTAATKEEAARFENDLHVRKAGTPPSSINLPTLTVENYAIRAGMGTCLDAKNEIYPGVNLVIFLGGISNEMSIKDKHLGHVFNDTGYWGGRPEGKKWDLEMMEIDEVSKNTEPGIRYWEKPQHNPLQVIPHTHAGHLIRGPLYGPGANTRLSGDNFNIGLSSTVCLPEPHLLYMAPPRSSLYPHNPIDATEAQKNDFYTNLQQFERTKFWNIIKENIQNSSPWTMATLTDAYAAVLAGADPADVDVISQPNFSTYSVFGEYLLRKRTGSEASNSGQTRSEGGSSQGSNSGQSRNGSTSEEGSSKQSNSGSSSKSCCCALL